MKNFYKWQAKVTTVKSRNIRTPKFNHIINFIEKKAGNPNRVDGSLRNGLAGAGIYSDDYEINAAIQLSSLTSIFQAELFAILHRASPCLTAEFRGRHIDICSDSHAALMAWSPITLIPNWLWSV